MITLSMIEASMAQTVKNAALLSPCHNQNSCLRAVFRGNRRRRFESGFLFSPRGFFADVVLDMFLFRAMFFS
jgi:hypothetical protein